jgi:outer membrane protein TolC
VTATVRRAQHLDAAAAASQRATARSLALDVLRAYWAVRRAELQAAVSEQAIARFRDGVRVVRSRVDSGLAPPVDLNRMETRKLREEARLASLKGSAAEGRAQLAVALGLGGAELSLTEGADVPPLPPATAAEADRLLAAARGGRAELQAARRQTLAAVEAVRVAFSGYYPQLSGSLQLQWGNGSYYSVLGGAGFMTPSSSANPFASTTLSFLVGATLSINLFDTLNTRTAVRDARLVVAREREEERRLGRLVELDVRTALARLQRLYAARAPLLETRGQARDSLAIIERRYRNGESTILDYLDAQLELLSSELDLADAAASIALGWGELAAATGRLPGAGGRR